MRIFPEIGPCSTTQQVMNIFASIGYDSSNKTTINFTNQTKKKTVGASLGCQRKEQLESRSKQTPFGTANTSAPESLSITWTDTDQLDN